MKYSKCGMIKGRVALPKYLFHVATQIEKDRFTLIEQSAPIVLLRINTMHAAIYLAHNQSSHSSP